MVTKIQVATSRTITQLGIRGILHFIATSPQLSEVELHDGDKNPSCMVELLSAVGRNKNIKTLCLTAVTLLVTQTLALCLKAKRKSLTSLELRVLPLGQPQQDLVAHGNLHSDAETVADAIKSLKRLNELAIWYADVQDFLVPFLIKIGSGAPLKLEYLRLLEVEAGENNDEVSFATAVERAITNMPKLSQLSLYPEGFHPTDNFFDILFRGLENHPSIRGLNLFDTRTCVPIVRLMMLNTRIKHLSVGVYQMSWCGVRSIWKALTREKTLESFVMRDMNMDHRFEEKQDQLGLYLRKIGGLQKLYLTSNMDILGRPVSESVPPALLQGFTRNTSLIHVEMDWCPKGSFCHKAIDFYTVRNCFNSKPMDSVNSMLHCLEETYELCKDPEGGHYDENAIGVAFDCLRSRNDWDSRTP